MARRRIPIAARSSFSDFPLSPARGEEGWGEGELNYPAVFTRTR